MDLYRDNILDHYKHPRNFGKMKQPDASHEEYNTVCGDKVRIDVQFKIQNSKFKIQKILFSGEGCAINQASASMLTELVKGKTIEEIEKLTKEDIFRLIQTIPTPSRVKCATLPLEVLQKAVKKIEGRSEK